MTVPEHQTGPGEEGGVGGWGSEGVGLIVVLGNVREAVMVCRHLENVT